MDEIRTEECDYLDWCYGGYHVLNRVASEEEGMPIYTDLIELLNFHPEDLLI